MIQFPSGALIEFWAWTHKTTTLIITITSNYSSGITCSIPFVKAFHQNVQSVHKGFTV